jgi:hypothetical protein
MTNKIINYKKIRTDIINGKKRCIYIKLKGKREYVKSKGEFVLLSVYIKKMQKKYKNKGGEGSTRSKMPPHSKMKDPFDIYYEKQSEIRGNINNKQSNIVSMMKNMPKNIATNLTKLTKLKTLMRRKGPQGPQGP